MWSSWFGGGSSTSSPSSSSSAKKNPTPKDAILGLRQQLDMLQKRETHLENQIEEADRLARKNVNTNKTAARGALRKKKMHEHNLEQLQAQIATMEQNVMAIETANINYANLEVMRQAGKAMKKIHNGLDMDKVENIMDELHDQHALTEEIGAAMSRNPLGEQIDETELDKELEELEQENTNAQLLGAGPTPVGGEVASLPAVSTGPVRSKVAQREEDEEEEELRKLQAEMAM